MINILLIEDDELSRQALAQSLRGEGYRVLESENGLEGVEIYKREKIDLVITDLKMPKLDGYGVLSKMREIEKAGNRGEIPLIIMSGLSEAGSLKETNYHYFQKPGDLEILIHKIKSLLSQDLP